MRMKGREHFFFTDPISENLHFDTVRILINYRKKYCFEIKNLEKLYCIKECVPIFFEDSQNNFKKII